MKKGFTLVELLAVLIVIALLSTFVIANIISQSNNFKDMSSSQFEEVIKGSAKAYVNDRESLKNDIRSGIGKEICKKDLLDNNYISDNIKNLKNFKNYNNFCVKVSYSNNSYTYEIKSKTGTDCINCPEN